MKNELSNREKYLKKIRGFYNDVGTIKVITGIRRCGKSCLMETIRKELIVSGVNEDHIFNLDLDSRKYRKVKMAEQLDELIDSMPNVGGTKYLFIDEIQNVKDFEEVINSYRQTSEYSIFITGSNSYLLSGELITKLTGRYIEFELFPLSFDEYLDFKRFYKKNIESNLVIELNNYLLEGGFPKTIEYDNFEDKRTYVEAVIKEIFEKDIKMRIKIRRIEAFNGVSNFIINDFGSMFSIQSLQEVLGKMVPLLKEIHCLDILKH